MRNFYLLLRTHVPTAQLILDWFHLQGKCYQFSAMICSGKKAKATLLGTLYYHLWRGQLDEAIQVLTQCRPQAKSEEKLDDLLASLEARRPFILDYQDRRRQRQYIGTAAKKASREANQALVNVLVDASSRLGAIVEVNCETDFVARTEDFKLFVASLVEQVAQTPGLSEASDLLKQPYIQDRSLTVGERVTQHVAKLGENMVRGAATRIERDRHGLIEGYVHPGSRIGVLVYLLAGSQDVSSGATFRELVHDLALQIAAAAPEYISTEDIPSST